MRLLLDTHIVLWLARSPERLNSAERSLLENKRSRRLISSATIWELRIKWTSRRSAAAQEGLMDPLAAIAFAEGNGFELAALTPADCATSLDVPLDHRDPFDEMLLIHAARLGARLLTRDRLLAHHPLALAR
ncbi:MAG: type II toxin-antitoxin system VapC family toxin [Sphingomonas sp.]